MSKVPFALHNESAKYIDVHDVARGSQCSCICPSCKTPLIARQGKANSWHFAHNTHGTAGKTDRDCEFSFYVSVVQMAKQLFLTEKEIDFTLPDYIYELVEPHPINGRSFRRDVSITRETSVRLEDVSIEAKHSGHSADILVFVRDFPLLVRFSHPERTFVADPEPLEGLRAGILEIDLSATRHIFFDFKERGKKSFSELLKDYLFSSPGYKLWLYHPREDKRLKDARKSLFDDSSNLATSMKHRPDKPGDFIDRALANFVLTKKAR